MALEHRTVVGGIQIERSGNVHVLLKLIVADGAEEISDAPMVPSTQTSFCTQPMARPFV